MTVLTLIGYWRPEDGSRAQYEESMTDPDLPPDIQRQLLDMVEREYRLPIAGDFVDHNWSPEERQAVGDHLARGLTLQQYRGLSRCRLCGQHNGSKELTDRTYYWPEGLSHYVLAHHVRLPQEFVGHVLSIPPSAEQTAFPTFDQFGQRVEDGTYDGLHTAWVAEAHVWSREHRTIAGFPRDWLNSTTDTTWWDHQRGHPHGGSS